MTSHREQEFFEEPGEQTSFSDSDSNEGNHDEMDMNEEDPNYDDYIRDNPPTGQTNFEIMDENWTFPEPEIGEENTDINSENMTHPFRNREKNGNIRLWVGVLITLIPFVFLFGGLFGWKCFSTCGCSSLERNCDEYSNFDVICDLLACLISDVFLLTTWLPRKFFGLFHCKK